MTSQAVIGADLENNDPRLVLFKQSLKAACCPGRGLAANGSVNEAGSGVHALLNKTDPTVFDRHPIRSTDAVPDHDDYGW